MAATGLHYGQEAFEGLKAYRGRDGKVRLFRWEENAKRTYLFCKGSEDGAGSQLSCSGRRCSRQ
ncbi:MAG: hypothetical protein MZV63_21945 [Marinilabiliales bacterium]|nr:hypothetical protein [Marinilabiliales bacterium]